MRRSAYKGGNTIVHSLPVDGASTIGICIIVATVLPASCLNLDGLKACKSILEILEGDDPVTEFEVSTSKGQSVKIEASSSGKFKIDQLKPVWKKHEVNYSRPGGQKRWIP